MELKNGRTQLSLSFSKETFSGETPHGDYGSKTTR
jgi:hypothetical protein